jgi:hypothetical protein
MAEQKKPHRKAELRTRWRAMLEDGSLASLRSEGRLVALYVLCMADWASCEARFSMRRAAKGIGVHPTTVRRGISQMIDAGILEVLHKGEGTEKSRFRVVLRAQPVRTPDTSGARLRARAVRAPDTSGARSGHEPCAERTRVVSGARTRCAHNSVFISGSPVRTSEISSTADAGAGVGPARRRRPSRLIEGVPPPSAAGGDAEGPGVDASDTFKEEVIQ